MDNVLLTEISFRATEGNYRWNLGWHSLKRRVVEVLVRGPGQQFFPLGEKMAQCPGIWLKDLLGGCVKGCWIFTADVLTMIPIQWSQ